MISVCIITGRRITLLDACLRSLQAQDDPPPFEVLVCSDGDPHVAAAVAERFPRARVCAVDRALPGAGRNLLVEVAQGDLLLFLDDDVTAEPTLLRRLADLAERHPDVGVFGGPNDSPPSSSSFQFVQGAVLASMVGSGPVRRRYGAHPAGPADQRSFTLCNLAIRRDVMVPFSDELVCAEENDVLHQLARHGVAMRYEPDLVVYHERRATLGGFARQVHKYGRGRGQLVARRPSALSPAFVAPSALVAYVALVPLAVVVLGPMALVPLVAYVGAVGAGSLWIARTLRRLRAAPVAAVCFVALHACYGTGFVRGVVERRRPPVLPRVLGWAGPEPVAGADR